MATTQVAPKGTKEVTLTVFDLISFGKVGLTKSVELPARPSSVEEALQAVGNDSTALLDVIYEGLVERRVEAAKKDMTGFKVDEDEDLDAETLAKIVGPDGTYTGSFADEKKTKLINGFVLSFAKMHGFDKSLPKDAKRKLKEDAVEFMRANPAILAGIQ